MHKKAVIEQVIKEFSGRFRVFDNTGDDKKVIAGQFPDIIIMRPEPPVNQDILFVMKVEDGDNLIDSVSEWQALGSAPSVLYILIPQAKLDEAKKLASATGVRARFAPYTIGANTVRIRYE